MAPKGEPREQPQKSMDKAEKAALKHVKGVGGIFIKPKAPAKLCAWFKTHLGIDVQTWGEHPFAGSTLRAPNRS